MEITYLTTTVGTTTAYVNEIAYYPSFNVSGSAVSGQGDPTILWSAPTDEGAPADAVVPLNETGKSMGYALIRVGVKVMGAYKPDAVVLIDWDSLAIQQLDDPPTPEVNHDALNAAIASAQALEQGKKSDEAFAALQRAISEAQMALGEGVPQPAVDAAVTRLQQAIETFKNSPDTNAVSRYALGKALEECRALVAQEGVSPEKAQALQAAIDAAQEVYDRDSATQDEVNAQVSALALAKSEFYSYTAPIGFADTVFLFGPTLYTIFSFGIYVVPLVTLLRNSINNAPLGDDLAAGSAFLAPAVAMVGFGSLLIGVAPQLGFLSWGFPIWTLVVGMLAEILQLPGWARRFSPLDWVGNLPGETADGAAVLLLATSAAVAVLAGGYTLDRRDLLRG